MPDLEAVQKRAPRGPRARVTRRIAMRGRSRSLPQPSISPIVPTSCLGEAGADMPHVDPALLRVVAYGKHQGAEVLARPARLSVTDNHRLLLMYRLELEPLARSLA